MPVKSSRFGAWEREQRGGLSGLLENAPEPPGLGLFAESPDPLDRLQPRAQRVRASHRRKFRYPLALNTLKSPPKERIYADFRLFPRLISKSFYPRFQAGRAMRRVLP